MVGRKGGKRTKEKCEERRGWRDRVSERVAAGETRAFCLDGMGWMKLEKMEADEKLLEDQMKERNFP
jgi:hypothetical protein